MLKNIIFEDHLLHIYEVSLVLYERTSIFVIIVWKIKKWNNIFFPKKEKKSYYLVIYFKTHE